MISQDKEQDQIASARLILVMRGLRSLAYGLMSVPFGIALANSGFEPVAIGILITISLVGDMVGTYVIGLFADTWGAEAHALAAFTADGCDRCDLYARGAVHRIWSAQSCL